MKRLVIVFALVVSVGLNAKNLSDEEFYELVNDCLDNDNKVSCQKLVESKLLASVDKCKDTCGNIGMVYYFAENHQQANLYFKKECDTFNEPTNCYNLGLAYNKGKGIRQDFAKARHYFEKGCKLNDGEACNSLAGLYYEGRGVKQNLSIAKQYAGKACDLGEQRGCNNYKMLNEQGIQ